MRLAWMTDIHLNFTGPESKLEFYEHVKSKKADAVVITGDISEAPKLIKHLKDLQSGVQLPVHFVLGNHDFYDGSVIGVRKAVAEMCKAQPTLVYLRDQVVELTPTTCLVGVDGWADAKFGKPEDERITLADWTYIEDYAAVQARWSYENRMRVAEMNAYVEANVLRHALEQAVSNEAYVNIIVATHVPPFWEATWHRGKHSDPDWVPWFSCKQVGDVLASFAKRYPLKKFTVLCGHTHGEGEFQHSPNLLVRTGSAEYRYPEVYDVLELA